MWCWVENKTHTKHTNQYTQYVFIGYSDLFAENFLINFDLNPQVVAPLESNCFVNRLFVVVYLFDFNYFQRLLMVIICRRRLYFQTRPTISAPRTRCEGVRSSRRCRRSKSPIETSGISPHTNAASVCVLKVLIVWFSGWFIVCFLIWMAFGNDWCVCFVWLWEELLNIFF